MTDTQTKIREILTECGAWSSDAVWKVQNTWCIKHKALEIAAAAKKIQFDPPVIIESNSLQCVSMVVTGQMGDRTEWSIGECSTQNYKAFSNDKMAAYPWAMAEKRAKDRVILKLIGLHGYAYAEDEADDFKAHQSQPQPAARHERDKMQDRLLDLVADCPNPDALKTLWSNTKFQADLRQLSEEGQLTVTQAKDARKQDFNIAA